MNLFEQVKDDVKTITTSEFEFSTEVTFTSLDADVATVMAQYSDHSNSYSEEGVPITGKFSHVTIAEEVLTDVGYPTRNSDGLIDMLNHTMVVTYADGTTKNYIVCETRPDYTINLILLILSSYAGDN